MTLDKVRSLHTDDEVYWTDPDGGKTSRHYTISTIEILGEIVRIVDRDGSTLECFASELS